MTNTRTNVWLARAALVAVGALPVLAGLGAASTTPPSDVGLIVTLLAGVAAAGVVGAAVGPAACRGIARAQAGTSAAFVGLAGLAGVAAFYALAEAGVCDGASPQPSWSVLWIALAAYAPLAAAAVRRPLPLVVAWPLTVLAGIAVALLAFRLGGPVCLGGE